MSTINECLNTIENAIYGKDMRSAIHDGMDLLRKNIDSEEANREATDAALQQETANRKSADTTLQTNINNEATSRKNADEDLQTNIDDETANREENDGSLVELLNDKANKHTLIPSNVVNTTTGVPIAGKMPTSYGVGDIAVSDEKPYILSNVETVSGSKTTYNLTWTPLATNDDLKYSNDTPTLTSHGGVEVGETFDNVSIKDMFNKILYPWVAPIVKLTMSGILNGAVYEKGTTQKVSSYKLDVTKQSDNINSVILYQNGKNISAFSDAAISALNTKGSYNQTTADSSGVVLSLTSDTSFLIKVTDAKNKTTSSNSITVGFVYPYYYGVVSADTTLSSIKASTVSGLTKIIEKQGTKSVTYNASNQKMVFAYPTSYGTIAKITDPNGFDVSDTFSRTTLSITGTDGSARQYYVFVSNEASTVTNFTMKFTN